MARFSKRWLIPVMTLMFLSSRGMAEGYLIRFRVAGIHDTTCLIANYYGNGTYIYDTLKVDATGRFTFRAPADIPKGIYIAVITDKSYFEFIVNNDHDFSMETRLPDLSGNMKISSSPENSLFYDYIHYNRKKFQEIQHLQARQKTLEWNPDSLAVNIRQIEAINEEVVRYKLDLAGRYPGSFVALLIGLMKEPVVPEIPVLPNGRKDSTFASRYYREHFWDGMDFTDDRVLRTPVFHNKLVKYFDKVLPQNPDTIIRVSDLLIEKSRPNPEMFKYLVWFTTNHYENSEIMGFDKIFVHAIDRYYITNEATWVKKSDLDNLVRKANRIRPLLIGTMAPNMIMADTNGQLVSMYSIRATYLILLFWDPDCGHCETEIPKLKELYDQKKSEYGMEIFAVCSDSSLTKWKSSIRKKGMNWINVDGPRTLTGDYHTQYDITTTPVIYILNNRKEILAKNLTSDQVRQFIEMEFRRNAGP